MAKDKKKEGKQRRPSALKRDIQAKRNNLRNRSFKARVRTAIRKLDADIEAKDAGQIETSLRMVHALMDKGAQKGIFKDNKASRTKARVSLRVNKAAV